MHIVKRLTTCIAILTLLIAITGSQALGEVNVNINIGVPLPPAVVVEAPPVMIFLSEPGIYVAVGIPYSIFFLSGRYYYYHNDHWFWAPGYGEPWVHIKDKSLPPGLRKYKIQQLHAFRDREFELYKVHGDNYRGKHFNASEDHGHKSEEHSEKGHKKHGKDKRD